MAIESSTDSGLSTTEAAFRLYRLSVEQFLAMIDAGIFPDHAHVELLGGVLIEMMVKGDLHDYALGALGEEIRRRIPDGWICREDKSLRVGPRSRPEPDIAVVRGPRKQYSHRTPEAREATLVAEVAETSYAYDRGVKWRAYASARIPIYWIVNIVKGRVEVFRNPTGRGNTAVYRESETFGPGDEIPVIIDGQEIGRIPVSEILP